MFFDRQLQRLKRSHPQTNFDVKNLEHIEADSQAKFSVSLSHSQSR